MPTPVENNKKKNLPRIYVPGRSETIKLCSSGIFDQFDLFPVWVRQHLLKITKKKTSQKFTFSDGPKQLNYVRPAFLTNMIFFRFASAFQNYTCSGDGYRGVEMKNRTAAYRHDGTHFVVRRVKPKRNIPTTRPGRCVTAVIRSSK